MIDIRSPDEYEADPLTENSQRKLSRPDSITLGRLIQIKDMKGVRGWSDSVRREDR